MSYDLHISELSSSLRRYPVRDLLYCVVLTLGTRWFGRFELFVTDLGDVDLALCWGSRFDRCEEIVTQRYGIIALILPVDRFVLVPGLVDLARRSQYDLDRCPAVGSSLRRSIQGSAL